MSWIPFIHQSDQMDQMDHSGHAMGHSMEHTMDHSSHILGHAGMNDGDSDMCSMNMLFTWDYKNMCVIFRWWHVRTRLDLILTMLAIGVISMGYEYVRYRMRLLDLKASSQVETSGPPRLHRAIGYGLMVGYSYLLMLVFMTYNGWAMLSVAVGASVGFYRWGAEGARTMACH